MRQNIQCSVYFIYGQLNENIHLMRFILTLFLYFFFPLNYFLDFNLPKGTFHAIFSAINWR